MPKRGYADVVEKDPTKAQKATEERIGQTTQKLNEADRRALHGQIAQREDEIASAKDLNPDADVSAMKKEIDHKKMILQRDDDLTPKSGLATDRLAARAREIESVLKGKMPTKREMWPKPGTAEAQTAVRHNLKFQEQYDHLCKEWQDIQVKLNPDDPFAQSLESIRPD